MIASMYNGLLLVHSWVRWVVLICAVLAVVGAILNIVRRTPWSSGNDRAALFFTISADIQLLLGVMLFVVGPAWFSTFMNDPGAAMSNRMVRYWSIEHGFGMIVAIALVHLGKVLVRKKADAFAKNRTALIFFGLALLIMIGTIPWAWNPVRPLFRM
jgi:hypothetical protein